MNTTIIILVSMLAIAGIITRPLKVPEYIWACGGAFVLLIFGLLNLSAGLAAITKGMDVYLFLIGMMMLAESARIEGFFDWLAAHSTRLANGSALKLFFLIYAVGTAVTAFLSNDATAVVLTPAVIAAAKAGKVKNPIPYLLICVFIANAASFVFPISNPANLVIYGNHLPSLLEWLSAFKVPSIVSIVTTFAVLYFLQRKQLRQSVSKEIIIPDLSRGGKTAMLGLIGSAIILLGSSVMDVELGLPTFLAGLGTLLMIYFSAGRNPKDIIVNVSWQVIPLVAGLFVLVEAFAKTGLTDTAAMWLTHYAQRNPSGTAWGSGLLTAFGCNLINNLPAGLTAGNIIATSNPPEIIRRSILIGIDLGPNLS